MLERLDETIVAICSAPGSGPAGILRVSGPEAFKVVQQSIAIPEAGGNPDVTGDTDLSRYPGFSRLEAELSTDASGGHVPAILYLYRSPRSYTRQDMVEIMTIGNTALLETLIDYLIEHGAVRAQAGEFTARAFVNGRISLSEAEAVAKVIQARSDRQLRAARRLMDGELARTVADVTDKLGGLAALVEADIDFAEEPIDFIQPEELVDRLSGIQTGLAEIVAAARRGDQPAGLPQILLLGPPNAGKSSLLNHIAATDRAICAAVAGTTRDVLRAPVRLGEFEAELLDSAGIDNALAWPSPSVAGSADDPHVIDRESQSRASEAARQADVICIVVPVGAPLPPAIETILQPLTGTPLVMVGSKADLAATRTPSATVHVGENNPRISARVTVSVVTNEGIEPLKHELARQLSLMGSTVRGEGVALTSRQKQALRDADDNLERAIELARQADSILDCAELLAFDLRAALDALGSISGEVTTEALLGRIFSEFCIGK